MLPGSLILYVNFLVPRTRRQTEGRTEDEDRTNTIEVVVLVIVYSVDWVACQVVTVGIIKMVM